VRLCVSPATSTIKIIVVCEDVLRYSVFPPDRKRRGRSHSAPGHGAFQTIITHEKVENADEFGTISANLQACRERGMASVVLSILLLLQTVSPAAAVKVVNGRLSVEGGAPAPSSFTLPLLSGGGTSTPALPLNGSRSITIRPQIDGTFRVQLPPGEYRVGAPGRLPPGYTLKSIVYGEGDLLQGPLKISSDDSAELVINLAISGPSPAVSVSGHVTGMPPGQIQRIALREPNGGDLSAALETSVGPDGAFTFPKVLPGTYIVYLRLRAQTQVTVGNRDVTGLTVAYPQDILVSGHVIAEGAQTSIPAIIVEANGKPTTLQNRATATFILSLGYGENSVSVRNIPEGYRLKSITYGEVDLQKQPLKLDGPAIWDIIVRLAPKN
jgi:hypothetical protein